MKMKWSLLCLTLYVAAVLADELPLAEPCDEQACQLPNCRCSSTSIPGNLRARDTPQFVLLTFDDALNTINIDTYRGLLNGRVNSNSCPSRATFFVNHEYTDYTIANELYNNGHEIALHSITHQTPADYWRDADTETMRKEFGGQRRQMAHFANIPIHSITGLRKPFLQLSGNSSFQVIREEGLTYDCSWPTISFTNPGLWPYTLDYSSTQDDVIPPSPTASIPGVWVLPMVAWIDLNGVACSMVDGCANTPANTDEEGWFRFIVTNFERHYKNNRAPFGFYVHEWFLRVNPAINRALHRFLDLVSELNDAFLVSGNDVIDWVRNPIPVNQYRFQQCPHIQRTFCQRTSCGPLSNAANGKNYWMQSCAPCPRVHPWLDNYLGR